MGVPTDVTFKNILDLGGALGATVGTAPGSPFQVGIPQPLEAKVNSVGPVGPVTLAGIPDTFHLYLEKLPKLLIGLDPLTINPLTVNPVELNLALKEIPSVRAHLPADFRLGMSILGIDLLCLRLCGEAQVITEPYQPNPCEICRPELHTQNVPGQDRFSGRVGGG